MIYNNATQSLNMLNSFFKNELSIVDIPELVRIDSNYGLWNNLTFLNSNLKTLNLENMEQAPYIINCENLQNINLDKLQEVEFNVGSEGIYINSLSSLPTRFIHNSKIQSLNLPSFKGTQYPLPINSDDISSMYAQYASFWNNYWLRDVSLGNSLMRAETNTNYKFNGFWFRNNYFLKFLKLNYPYVIPLVRTAGFNTTPIGNGSGYIYVPKNLIEQYKSDTNWHNFESKIKTIENDYEGDFNSYKDSISDDWTTIINNCNKGAVEQYPIGGTKTVKINDVPIQFRIIGKNVDTITSGGTAALTWIETTISRFNTSSVRDVFSNNIPRHYSNANTFRSILTSIYDGIESDVKNGIKAVNKQSLGFNEAGTPGSYRSEGELVWPPSALELGLELNISPYEYYQTNPRRIINYYLGETNINEINGQKIRVALRDYSGQSNFPDLLQANSNPEQSMDVIDGDGTTNPYIIACFCT